jgi:hypothetical protein
VLESLLLELLLELLLLLWRADDSAPPRTASFAAIFRPFAVAAWNMPAVL